MEGKAEGAKRKNCRRLTTLNVKMPREASKDNSKSAMEKNLSKCKKNYYKLVRKKILWLVDS